MKTRFKWVLGCIGLIVLISVASLYFSSYSPFEHPLTFSLSDMTIKNASYYTEYRQSFYANSKQDLKMDLTQADDLFNNPTEYAEAVVWVTVKNNTYKKIIITECKEINSFPQGVWLDSQILPAYEEVSSHVAITGRLSILYKKNEFSKNEIEKLIKDGKVGIIFSYLNIDRTVPINKNTATFKF